MAELKVTLKPGQRVFVESWKDGYAWTSLQEIDSWDKEYFGDRINFRMPSGTFNNMIFAVKVEITGRKVHYKGNETLVKGKVTWLHDDGTDEPSSPIWIALDWDDYEYV